MSQDYLTVSALTKYIKRKFDVDPYLERVYLTGEISNFRLRPNHQYFSLKDDRAKISAVMFKGAFQKLKFTPKEGMKVLVVGRITLYEASGNYQIAIEHMEPDGVGALYQALAELKDKLNREGLFNLPKKNLPRFPKKIAVLTSPSGAVIRDIMTTVQRRYPIVQLVLFPTVVQGENSAPSIIKNIQRAEAIGDFDTLIIGRGGGSIEDLWSFNEEKVARAIVDCPIPVISSVGHETDTTIADLVADVRAATPTAAAELAVPVLSEEVLRIKEKQSRLEQAFLNQMERKKARFAHVKESYIFRQPQRLYEAQTVQLDTLKQRLQQSLTLQVHQKEKELLQQTARLEQVTPKNQVAQALQTVTYLDQRLQEQMNNYVEQKNQRLKQAINALDLLSPLKIMGRGYTYTVQEKQVIHSVAQLKKEPVTIHFADGTAQAQITAIKKEED
ncbi:exodeoxyribonuclease VII large subunit [Enterococcus sp. CSURQ0835]|uniref:exodeoxyribonuclease VII large subunit n=1 Tax=Enterococcus sp. CSURQ0835 TaxID=2681394 RepID=UPI00135B9767|nr:exodeoxyribonuclease VII large subunit [Enterococcus sp. CSURQ0835]